MENDIVICAAATLELVGKKADIYLIEIAEIGDAEKFEDAIEKEEKNEKIITKVLKKLKSRIKLWHDADRKGYATFRVEKHQESWPIDSKTFRDYIEHFVFKNRHYRDWEKQPLMRFVTVFRRRPSSKEVSLKFINGLQNLKIAITSICVTVIGNSLK